MAAALLDERHTGQTFTSAGPRSLTMTEVAAELTPRPAAPSGSSSST